MGALKDSYNYLGKLILKVLTKIVQFQEILWHSINFIKKTFFYGVFFIVSFILLII